MNKKYEAPQIEVINLSLMGYLCSDADIFFGGSRYTTNKTGSNNEDE